MKKRIIGSILLAALVAVLIFVGVKNANQNTQQNNKLKVTASFYPLYDFAKAVGGDKVQVTNITPAGAEPHDYEPSPRQLISMQKSQVFIYDGGTLEPWVDKFLPNYQHTAVKASSQITLQAGQDEDGTTSASVKDPHFWLDPILAQQIVSNIKDGLIKADPSNKEYFQSHAKAYANKLAKLNKNYRDGLASCKGRTIITSHTAFGYLANRYNFKTLSIAGVSPDEEPSPAKLAELSKLVKTENIKYIFFESLTSPRLAKTIAKETGANTLVLDPIEGLSQADQKQGKNYISVQQENLANLRTALSCK